MNVVFNNTLNITKFYYQFQQQKVYSIKVDKMFNLIFYAHKRMLKCFLFWFYLKNFPTMITKDNICNMWLVGFDIDSFVSIIKTFKLTLSSHTQSKEDWICMFFTPGTIVVDLAV